MLFRWPNHTLKRRLRLSTKLLIASSVAAIIGFSAICVSVMLDMRRGEEELARQMLQNRAASVDADISRNIELYDLSLRAVANNFVLPEVKHVGRPILHLILFDHAATAKHFSAIQVFDAGGQLILDASSLDPRPENRADEDYFTIHRDNPDAGLFISRPTLHRSAYSIVLSRRISGPDGAFLGVAVGAIRFTYFHDLFDRLTLDSDDTITVIRRDGTIIMRTPFDLDYVGRTISRGAHVKRALAEPEGWHIGPGAVDNLVRLFVWRNSGSPLIVIAGKPLHRILEKWRRQAIQIGSIVLALAGFVLIATYFLTREIGRRAAAEAKLKQLAITDALTGLRNRRKFDEDIDSEWRRAARQKTPLALLMIDADHFKVFNDTHGHQAGDQVLVGIAICISDSVHRPGDCAARYGGEEFAVLLPGCEAADAFKIAETIRRKVMRWSEGEAATTVSVGVASLTPATNMHWSQLVEAADKALYVAKGNGRNQSALASTPKMSLVA